MLKMLEKIKVEKQTKLFSYLLEIYNHIFKKLSQKVAFISKMILDRHFYFPFFVVKKVWLIICGIV